MKHLTTLISLSAALLTSDGFAQTWNGAGEVGFTQTSGNTDSSSLNVNLELKRDAKVWGHEIKITSFKVANDDIDVADSVRADYAIKRNLTERSNLFFSLSYLDDKFDGLTDQKSVAAGYGYKLINSEKAFWELSLGVGYRDVAQEADTVDESLGQFVAADLDISGVTGVFRSDFYTSITENSRVINDLQVEAGSDNTLIRNELRLEVDMNSHFFLSAGVLVRHNTDVSFDEEDTETITTFNLGYRLGAD